MLNSVPDQPIWRRVATPLAVLLLAIVIGLSACGGGQKTVWDGPPKSEAEAAYRDALSLMESGQYIEATKRFNQLRLDYPFSSRWTTLAELRLGDILLEQARYAAAAESFQQFVNSHPTHEEVPYALYRVGVCYFEEMPSDFFILPEPWQRELASARQAEAALRRFVQSYPDSQHADDAQQRLAEVRRRLALHQLYVAEFYLKREAVIGAMNRLLVLVAEYPDSPAAAPAFFLLARTYVLQDDAMAAAGALKRLVTDYGDSEYAPPARDWLARNGLEDVEPMTIETR